MIVARFVGTGGFLIRYFNGHTKQQNRQLNIFFDYQNFFIYQLMHNWIVLKQFLIYIKIDIKTAPASFGVITINRERIIRSC
jgi:hypothetical protein